MSHLPRPQLAAYAVIGLAVLVLGARWLAADSPSAGAVVPGGIGSGERAGQGGVPAPPPVEAPPRAATVHVAGAVRRPGVYRLAADARVKDAVRRAGGATAKADVNAVNLAALVQDGVQVVVPRRAPAGGAGGVVAGGAAALPAAPVNLNSATLEELQTLDGVGPVTAAAILEYRTQNGGFRSVEDLGQVPGIGPKTLEALRDKVVA